MWNAPSLVDIRPFQDKGWRESIRYTYFVTSPPESGGPAPVDKTAKRYATLGVEGKARVCLQAECVSFFEDEGGLVAWGQDAQDRGYLLGFAGDHVPLVKRLIATVKDADLGGTWGWAKALKPKLRTSYGCIME